MGCKKRRLSSNLTVFPVLVFLIFLAIMSQILPQTSKCRKFQYSAYFAANIKASNLSIIFSAKMKNAAKLEDATNIKQPHIFKCHKFQNAANMPFYFYFCPTFSYFYSCFFNIQILKSYFFLLFHFALLDSLETEINAFVLSYSTGKR